MLLKLESRIGRQKIFSRSSMLSLILNVTFYFELLLSNVWPATHHKKVQSIFVTAIINKYFNSYYYCNDYIIMRSCHEIYTYLLITL